MNGKKEIGRLVWKKNFSKIQSWFPLEEQISRGDVAKKIRREVKNASSNLGARSWGDERWGHWDQEEKKVTPGRPGNGRPYGPFASPFAGFGSLWGARGDKIVELRVVI